MPPPVLCESLPGALSSGGPWFGIFHPRISHKGRRDHTSILGGLSALLKDRGVEWVEPALEIQVAVMENPDTEIEPARGPKGRSSVALSAFDDKTREPGRGRRLRKKEIMHRTKTVMEWTICAAAMCLVGLTGCGVANEAELEVVTGPMDPLFGTPVEVRVLGLDPGESVRIVARSEDGAAQVFRSETTFAADENGIVDVSKQAPTAGGYADVDPFGIFWTMKPDGGPGTWQNCMFSQLPHIQVGLEVVTTEGETTSGEIRWQFQPPGVELVRIPVERDGLHGVLYRPPGEGPFPALILLGGSGGGTEEWWAKTMASNGFAALALPYFNHKDLPPALLEVPVELVGEAIAWLQGVQGVAAERIGIAGGSKGGELALLAAATYPEIAAVVGCVPSGIIWQGVHETEAASSWSLEGEPLPYASWFFSQEDLEKLMAGESVALRNTYAMDKNGPEILEAATIPVERINGPVFLISGTDDQMWPSDVFGDLVMERLETAGHPHERRHLKVAGAGHLVFLPVFLTAANREPVQFMFGGTAKADAHGSVEAWREMVDFLHRHLDPEVSL